MKDNEAKSRAGPIPVSLSPSAFILYPFPLLPPRKFTLTFPVPLLMPPRNQTGGHLITYQAL